ncbi:MAG: starch-binding protein [Cyclobacteriaceae bacterium]
MKKRILHFFACLAIASSSFAQLENDNRILLQGFYWEASHDYQDDWYEYVENLIPTMVQANVGMVWLPPPSDAGSWEGYLPRELNNFDNDYGTLAEHKSLLDQLGNNDIDAIADIVINHRVGMTNWVDFANPTWGTNSIVSNDEVWSQPDYSDINLRGNNDTGTPYAAARDIDHTQTFVQNDIKDWMNNLKAFGYDGWRYDYAHGFGTQYFSMYNAHSNPSFSVGEYWTNDKQTIQNWIDATGSNAFDFPTYYALKGAIRDNNYSYLAFEGAPSGGIGWDSKNYTTFVENHDTPDYDPSNNILNSGNVGQAYAYLLTHPGVPCIFWSHLFEWGEDVQSEIIAAAEVRKTIGIHSQSSIEILTSSANVYAAKVTGTNGEVIVKLGQGNWGDPSNENIAGTWMLQTSGNNYAIWSSSNVDPPADNNSYLVHTIGHTHAYAWDNNGNPLLGPWPGSALISQGDWMTIELNDPCANIIFSHNGQQQTGDLTVCSDATYYYENTWHQTDPLSSSPPDSTGTYLTSYYTKGYTHAYAWDDNQNPLLGQWPGAPLIASGDWMQIDLAAECTHLIFSNGGMDQTEDLLACSDATYYLNGQWHAVDPSSQQSQLVIYTQNFTHAYAWDDNQNSILGDWPGTPMINNGNWMSITLDATCANIIFSNNGASQTADLFTCADAPYYYDGKWYQEDPLSTANNVGINLYAQGYTHFYAWDDNGNKLAGDWPGSQLVDQGNGWKLGTVSADCANVIFSYNGTSQTADLATCEAEAYWNGTAWSTTANGRMETIQMKEEITDDELTQSFSLFPVPFENEMTISLSLEHRQTISISIFSLSGQLIKYIETSLEAGQQVVKITHHDLKSIPGVYTAKILVNEEQFLRKFILK